MDLFECIFTVIFFFLIIKKKKKKKKVPLPRKLLFIPSNKKYISFRKLSISLRFLKAGNLVKLFRKKAKCHLISKEDDLNYVFLFPQLQLLAIACGHFHFKIFSLVIIIKTIKISKDS